MLRVTEGMIFQQVTNSVRRAQKRAFDAQVIAQSGRRVNRLSDDPMAAARASVLNATLERLDGMGRVSARAEEELTVSESVLGQATMIYNRAREIAIAGANASMGAPSRAALAEEVAGLRSQMLTLANTRVADVYVFGGYKTTAEPFDNAGVYQGDNGVRLGEVAPGTTVKMNVAGDDCFVGGIDVFAELETLKTDLLNNDPAAVSTRLDQLELGFAQLNNARGRTGVYLNQLYSGDELRYEMESSSLVHRTEAVEADINEAFNALAHTQFNLQAAIAQAQKILAGLNMGIR